MDFRADHLDATIARIEGLVVAMLPRTRGPARPALERWRADAAALRFHLQRRPAPPLLVAVLGGTGTGKSTLVNRLLGQNVSATSFRRTYTAGAVAIAAEDSSVPTGWLGIEHVAATSSELPVRGRAGTLLNVALPGDLTSQITLIDTPDLDGDQPAHHTEADRAFRWVEGALFLVTPEKYQMTEMLPYYRLASRYALPRLFVMNKCEQQAVVEDYEELIRTQGGGDGALQIFVVPRDDAGYEPPPEQNLAALRQALTGIPAPDPQRRADGLRVRCDDLLGRMVDQVIAPLRRDRLEAERLIALLHGMETPAPGVDVNPLTQQLQKRMQQRSVLYLMGPQRVLERVRQAPGLLVRLPRVAWDYVMHGELAPGALNPNGAKAQEVPDFRAVLVDQLAVLQNRLDDTLRASPLFRQISPEAPPPYQQAFVEASEAGRIADEELAELRNWLEQRWNATPRDTRMLQTLLKYLPGGKQITRWTEAAPYLLVLAVATATHHLLGGVDLVVIGGWSIATWLTERLSNEVAAHTRQTNQKITDRFTRLAHEQIERMSRWLGEQAPESKQLDQLERLVDDARAASAAE